MADAVMAAVAAGGDRHIPLPGLADPYSQLAAPMISQGVVQGVLWNLGHGENGTWIRQETRGWHESGIRAPCAQA